MLLPEMEVFPAFGMPPTLVIGLIAGGDTALRNPVENAEDWELFFNRKMNRKIELYRACNQNFD